MIGYDLVTVVFYGPKLWQRSRMTHDCITSRPIGVPVLGLI